MSTIYIDLKELTQRVSLSPRTIREYAKDQYDPFPAVLAKGKLLFKWSDVEAWLERRRVTAASDVGKVVNELLAEFEGDENADSRKST